MIFPIGDIKLEESDFIPLKRGGTGFASGIIENFFDIFRFYSKYFWRFFNLFFNEKKANEDLKAKMYRPVMQCWLPLFVHWNYVLVFLWFLFFIFQISDFERA